MVKAEVYCGFSVGGSVTGRDPADSKIITALVLKEISLCDVPCNTDATLMYKAANVRQLPSATGRSIEATMWADLHEAKMLIDSMPDGDKKFDAMAEHQRAVEKTLAHQFKIRNDARLNRKPVDPVHSAVTTGLSESGGFGAFPPVI